LEEEKTLSFVGTIELEDIPGEIESIVPYEAAVAAVMDTGTFLVSCMRI
jgi:hypothetical protein